MYSVIFFFCLYGNVVNFFSIHHNFSRNTLNYRSSLYFILKLLVLNSMGRTYYQNIVLKGGWVWFAIVLNGRKAAPSSDLKKAFDTIQEYSYNNFNRKLGRAASNAPLGPAPSSSIRPQPPNPSTQEINLISMKSDLFFFTRSIFLEYIPRWVGEGPINHYCI